MGAIEGLIATAFKGWVIKTRYEIKKETSEKRLTQAQLQAVLKDAFAKTRRSYIEGLGAAMFESFLTGAVEAGFGLDQNVVRTLAFNYAGKIVDYSNQMTAEAASEAYVGILNRNKPPKVAYGFMEKIFGVDRRATRSLLAMFDKEELPNKTLLDRSSRKQGKMDNYVVAAINLRARRISEEESFSAKETSKALIWNLAAAQNIAPKDAMKRWVTARDEMVCKTCGPMNGKTVGLRDKFTIPDKRKVWSPQLHPNCRCRAVMVVKVKVKNNVRGVSRFSRVSKSNDNEWETQPRSPGGQFGNRPQQSRTMVLDRPRPQTDNQRVSTNARFDQLVTSLYSMPQVQMQAAAADPDIEAALDVSGMTMSKPKITMRTAPVFKAKVEMAKPVMEKVELSRVEMISEAVMTLSADELTDVQLNMPETVPESKVDLIATVMAETKPENKAKVKAGIEQSSGIAIDVNPLFGVHLPSDDDEADGAPFKISKNQFMTNDMEALDEMIVNAYQDSVSNVLGDLNESHETMRFRYRHNGTPINITEREMTLALHVYAGQLARDAVDSVASENASHSASEYVRREGAKGHKDDQPSAKILAADAYSPTSSIDEMKSEVNSIARDFKFDQLFAPYAPVILRVDQAHSEITDYTPGNDSEADTMRFTEDARIVQADGDKGVLLLDFGWNDKKESTEAVSSDDMNFGETYEDDRFGNLDWDD